MVHTYRSPFFSLLLLLFFNLLPTQINRPSHDFPHNFDKKSKEYIYLGKNLSNISHIICGVDHLDTESNSPLRTLKKQIKEGFLFTEVETAVQALEYALSLLQIKRNSLEHSNMQHIIQQIDDVFHQIADGALSIDHEVIRAHLRTLVINENLDVLGESTFYKHMRTKQGIHISGKLKVGKSAKFKKNVKIKGTLSVSDAVIDSLSVSDLSIANITISGTLSVNDQVINGNLQIPSFTSPGILHNDSSGNISTSLIVDADITNGTISNAKLATISSADIPGYIVVRDGSGNFATNMITLDGTPTNGTDAATKAYVDSVVSSGIIPKTPALVAAVSNQATTGLYTIDGVALSASDRVLLTAQTNPIENGLWLAQAGAWTRPADFASGSAAGPAYVLILSGTVNAGSSWLCSTPAAIIDTDPIFFVLFSLSNTTTGANVGAGTGLIFRDKTGNTLNFKSLIQGSHIVITNNTNDITLATDGTNLNTPNTIVARDASGNFAAQIISMTDGVLSGNLILTTNPSSSTAGNIMKGANRFIHNTGTNNIFVGVNAGNFTTSGTGQNSAFGVNALTSITTGNGNTAIGYQAGQLLTTGSNNIYVHANAGSSGENDTIRIGGSQTTTFIAGINNTGVSGDAVSIDSNGQLGITFSSRRFKRNIQDMGSISEKILELRPVTFSYNNNEFNTQEFGLIAEEVDEIFPAIVAKDKDGLPYTIRYQILPVLLLNELQKQHISIQKQQIAIEEMQLAIARLKQIVQKRFI